MTPFFLFAVDLQMMIEFFPSSRALVSIGGFTVYWYGVLYIIAFAVVYCLFGWLQRYRQLTLTRSQILELLAWGAVGAVGGGRLGYVLLYESAYYFVHPLEILQLSHGGMSSHGGLVGVAICTLIVWRQPSLKLRSINLAALFDVIAASAAWGLVLGRVGNIINQELYVTPLAQGMAVGFPLLIAAVLYWRLRVDVRLGSTLAFFLILYSVARCIEELFREPEWPLIFGWITRGQLYTVPFFLVGIVLFVYRLRNESVDRHS